MNLKYNKYRRFFNSKNNDELYDSEKKVLGEQRELIETIRYSENRQTSILVESQFNRRPVTPTKYYPPSGDST